MTRKKIVIDEDIQFIYDTQPKGGISFKEDFYNRMGDGYRTCIHVIDTPTIMSEFWLLEITSLENSIVMVDTRLDGDIAYKKGISDTIGELKTRMKKATETEQDDLANEIEILRTLSFEMGQQGEQIKKSCHTYFLKPTNTRGVGKASKYCFRNIELGWL